MSKKILYLLLCIGLIGGLYYVSNKYRGDKNNSELPLDYKNATYTIDGKEVKLINGYAEIPTEQSSSKIITRYFGNALITDLNDDGRSDVVFLITQDMGGSGNFYYVVAAINTPKGYVGSDAYLLGDRIAPQTTELSKNPNHVHVIVINYAERKIGEPFSVSPHIGKSVYLKLDQNNKWGIIISPTESESL